MLSLTLPSTRWRYGRNRKSDTLLACFTLPWLLEDMYASISFVQVCLHWRICRVPINPSLLMRSRTTRKRFMRFFVGLRQILRGESEDAYCLFSIICFWICTYLSVAMSIVFSVWPSPEGIMTSRAKPGHRKRYFCQLDSRRCNHQIECRMNPLRRFRFPSRRVKAGGEPRPSQRDPPRH